MFFGKSVDKPRNDTADGAPKPLLLTAPPAGGPTVLPASLASAVSFITRSSTISIRLTSIVGEVVLDGVRVGAMTGIDIGRTVLERVLLTAGRDVRDTRGETWAGKGMDALHSSLSLAQLLLSTSLHLSSFSLNSISALCQSSIMTIDSIFGDTESSRAIAAIMALLQREFGDDGTNSKEIVNVREVVGGIAWFALVQMRCRRRERETLRGKAGRKLERVLWDVVVLEGEGLKHKIERTGSKRPMPADGSAVSVHPTEAAELDMDESCSSGSGEDDSDLDSIFGSDDDSHDENGKRKIRTLLCSRLPPSASISVTTSSHTTSTTTVEVVGTTPPDFSPPKNAIILSEASHHASGINTPMLTNGEEVEEPRYRIVYQTVTKKEKKRKIRRRGGENEPIVTEDVMDLMMDNDEKPEPTQKLLDVVEWRGNTVNSQDTLGTQVHDIMDERIQPMATRPSPVENYPLEMETNLQTATIHPAGFVGQEEHDAQRSMLDLLEPEVQDYKARISDEYSQRESFVSPTSPPNGEVRQSNTANTKRSIVSSAVPPKTTKPISTGIFRKKDRPTSPPLKTKDDKEKERRTGSLKKAWNSSTFLPAGPLIPGRDKRKINSAASLKDNPPPLSTKDLRSPSKSRRSSPIMTRTTPSDATTTKTRTEVVGLQRSSSRASSDNGDGEERLERQNSYLSMRSRTSMTTKTTGGDYRNSYHAQEPHNPPYHPQRISGYDEYHNIFPRSGASTPRPLSPVQSHRYNRKTAPSIYTLRTTNSQTSLYRDFSSGPNRNSPAHDDMSHAGVYPPNHPVLNMAKFVRFASASYGQDFLRLFGIGEAHPKQRFVSTDTHHAEHHAFSHHTGIPIDKIVLSSFTDTKVDVGSSGNGLVPLVHFVCIDEESKAIVVTCRGTLGLEDVLTDMTCDYDNLNIRGQIYRVHKGMLNSALTLVRKRSKLLQVVRDALIQHEGYGLVFCGHSLGGGVAAILAILLSEPCGVGFVTANSNTEDSNAACPEERTLIPTGRPVHCYTFGSPACVDTALRLATRRLITSIVHGADIVPSLSIGTLRDFQAVALAFKQDSAPEGAKVVEEIRRRVLINLARRRAWLDEGDDDFLWAVLKTLRAAMSSEKLVPPGEVVIVSAETVFTKEGGSVTEEEPAGPMRQAVKVTARLIKSVETRFGEVKFGRGMFADHSPKEYENCLNMLVRGVCGNVVN